MVDISARLDNTDVIDINSRIASTDDLLSSSTKTDKNKVFTFFDTEQIIKPLSNKLIVENNTKELSQMSDDSIELLSRKVDYPINTDEDLEKAFIDVNSELEKNNVLISFDSSFTNINMSEKIPSIDKRTDISYSYMSKENMEEHINIQKNNDYLRNLIYDESITTTSDYNFSELDSYEIDTEALNESNLNCFDSLKDTLNFYSPDDETMEHFKNLSLDSVNDLKNTYGNMTKFINSTCDNLSGIFSGILLDVNGLIKGFGQLLNISIGFNNSSLLNDLLNCFSIASDTLTDAKNITSLGKGISKNGSFSLIDGVLEKSSKANLSFPSLISKTFGNIKKKSPYIKSEIRDEYNLLKVKFNIDDTNELKRSTGTTKLKNDSILDEEDIFDIHKIQKNKEYSSFVLTENDEDTTGNFNLLKNQPLIAFI